jgi:hypothetical protein
MNPITAFSLIELLSLNKLLKNFFIISWFYTNKYIKSNYSPYLDLVAFQIDKISSDVSPLS